MRPCQKKGLKEASRSAATKHSGAGDEHRGGRSTPQNTDLVSPHQQQQPANLLLEAIRLRWFQVQFGDEFLKENQGREQCLFLLLFRSFQLADLIHLPSPVLAT